MIYLDANSRAVCSAVFYFLCLWAVVGAKLRVYLNLLCNLKLYVPHIGLSGWSIRVCSNNTIIYLCNCS